MGPCRRGIGLTTFWPAGKNPGRPRNARISQTTEQLTVRARAARFSTRCPLEARHLSALGRATGAGYTADNALPYWSSEHLRLLASARFTTEACVTKRTGSRLAPHGSLPRFDQPDDVCLTIPICANRATRASDRQPDIGERELERLGSAVHARFEATHPSAPQRATEAGHTADNALPHWSSEHLRLLASARFTTEACVTHTNSERTA
jgi:hypothetical protein